MGSDRRSFQKQPHNVAPEKSHPDNGQVERMNCTIKDATVKRYHYDNHAQLIGHLGDFLAAYNFGRRLKTVLTVLIQSLAAPIHSMERKALAVFS
jgi:hypothetical protein